ncbi:conserved hypothetical protein [Neospora caninum Liverpool]|uniref:Uncharacterized protein n=1 Tax=Neospora caninum (strain Liverpool) TaxID=572307 RepID=F0VR92_NEOCL|nr:conserved hypothetical protein [Neospora caninum Liverpool]CBZ56240.1 conserved hypothetical protein [Neospora caninum Liverpool]CEL71002.1 TPA: hypothetical protein BN1204_066650 [Neospora caninum Liverpool]|eukprot:XP_003886265.1 conserved hypothetical protein [Neospora caninum Liverpool]
MDLPSGGSEGEKVGGPMLFPGSGTCPSPPDGGIGVSTVCAADLLPAPQPGDGKERPSLQRSTSLSAPLYFSLPVPLFPCAAPAHLPPPSTLSGLVSTADDFASWGVALESLAAATFRASLLELLHSAYLPSRPRLMWRRVKRRLRGDGECWGEAESAEGCERQAREKEGTAGASHEGGKRGPGERRLSGHCDEGDGPGAVLSRSVRSPAVPPEKATECGLEPETECGAMWGRNGGRKVTEMMKRRELLLEDVCSRFFLWFYVDVSRKMITDGLSLARRRLPVDWVYRHYGTLLTMPECHFDIYPPYCIPIAHERTASFLGDMEGKEGSPAQCRTPVSSDSLSEVSDSSQEAEPEEDGGETLPPEASSASLEDSLVDLTKRSFPEEADEAVREEVPAKDAQDSGVEALPHIEVETSSGVHTPEDSVESGVSDVAHCSPSNRHAASLEALLPSSSEAGCDSRLSPAELSTTELHDEDSDAGDTGNSFPLSGACPAPGAPVPLSAGPSVLENSPASPLGAAEPCAASDVSPRTDAGTPSRLPFAVSPVAKKRTSSPIHTNGEVSPQLFSRRSESGSPWSSRTCRASVLSEAFDSSKKDELAYSLSRIRQVSSYSPVFSPSYADFRDLRAAVSRGDQDACAPPQQPATAEDSSRTSCASQTAAEQCPENLTDGASGDSSTGSDAEEPREDDKDDFLIVLSESEAEETERMHQLAATMRRSLQTKGRASPRNEGAEGRETARAAEAEAGAKRPGNLGRSGEPVAVPVKKGNRESLSSRTRMAQEHASEEAEEQEEDNQPIVERTGEVEERLLQEETVHGARSNEETATRLPADAGSAVASASNEESRIEEPHGERKRARSKGKRDSGLAAGCRRSARLSSAAREKSAVRGVEREARGRAGCMDSEKREGGEFVANEGAAGAEPFFPSSSEEKLGDSAERRGRVARRTGTDRKASSRNVLLRRKSGEGAACGAGRGESLPEGAHHETFHAVPYRARKRRKTHERVVPEIAEDEERHESSRDAKDMETPQRSQERKREERRRRLSNGRDGGEVPVGDGGFLAAGEDVEKLGKSPRSDFERETDSEAHQDTRGGSRGSSRGPEKTRFLEKDDSLGVASPERHEKVSWLGTDSDEDGENRDSSPATSKRTVDLLSPPPSPAMSCRQDAERGARPSVSLAVSTVSGRLEGDVGQPVKDEPRAHVAGSLACELESTEDRQEPPGEGPVAVAAGRTRPLFSRFPREAHAPFSSDRDSGALKASALQAQMMEIFGGSASQASQARKSCESVPALEGEGRKREDAESRRLSTLGASAPVDLWSQYESERAQTERLSSETEDASFSVSPRREDPEEAPARAEAGEARRELGGKSEEREEAGRRSAETERDLGAEEQRERIHEETRIPRFRGYRLHTSGRFLRGSGPFAQRYLQEVDARLEAIETQLAAAKAATETHRAWGRVPSFARLPRRSVAPGLEPPSFPRSDDESPEALETSPRERRPRCAVETPHRACTERAEVSLERSPDTDSEVEQSGGERTPQLAEFDQNPGRERRESGLSGLPWASREGAFPTADHVGIDDVDQEGDASETRLHRGTLRMRSDQEAASPCARGKGGGKSLYQGRGIRTGLQRRQPVSSTRREGSPVSLATRQTLGGLPGARGGGGFGKSGAAPRAAHAAPRAFGRGPSTEAGREAAVRSRSLRGGVAASRGVSTPGARAAGSTRLGDIAPFGRSQREVGKAETHAPAPDACRPKRSAPLPRVALFATQREQKQAKAHGPLRETQPTRRGVSPAANARLPHATKRVGSAAGGTPAKTGV